MGESFAAPSCYNKFMTEECSGLTRRRKKEIVEKIIENSGAKPTNHPSGIFMAGLPGAGKTELSQALIKTTNVAPVRIDMDELATFVEGYRPEKANLFRKDATSLVSEVYAKTIKNNLDFIMDGTFSSRHAKVNIGHALKRGYQIEIIYVCQDPKIAWDFTKAREKVKHRAINFDGFIDCYYNTIENIKDIYKTFYSKISIDIAYKTKDNSVGKWQKNVDMYKFDELINMEYNKDKLIKYILGQ